MNESNFLYIKNQSIENREREGFYRKEDEYNNRPEIIPNFLLMAFGEVEWMFGCGFLRIEA